MSLPFCVKLGKSALEPFEMIKKKHAKTKRLADLKHLNGTNGLFGCREAVNDESRAGRNSTSRNAERVAKVRGTILSDQRMTVRELSGDWNISDGSCQNI